jgi:hypothetical protein
MEIKGSKITDPIEQSLLGQPIMPQLVKKFSSFYGTQRFITLLTRDQDLSLF